ncbi:hypothetical protein PILCRDRAFT_12587 [Piloderma croceum F 1598]|uniref:Uncharacterized protein n=1 Tax=Piloderma croceum (strain F 1598) TaxID=765440 RepID=A0A0C3FAE7_PILCF|nr:hypothetical protein PILCRDRAFT_12587 [Piloderma croceum F 1598]
MYLIWETAREDGGNKTFRGIWKVYRSDRLLRTDALVAEQYQLQQHPSASASTSSTASTKSLLSNGSASFYSRMMENCARIFHSVLFYLWSVGPPARVKVRPITSHCHPILLLIFDLHETWTLLTSHFISTVTPLATINRTLFQLYLQPLLGFLPSLILPNADPGPIPTIAKPFPTGGSFTLTLTGSSKLTVRDDADDDGMAMDEGKT